MMKVSLFVAIALAFSIVPAHASVITFTGSDSGAGFGAPHPNSDAAQASFAAAAGGLGSLQLITFESLPLSTINNGVAFSLAPGVSVTVTNTDPAFTRITNDNSDSALGFNITSGGSQFMQVSPNFGGPDVTVTFNFSGSGTSAFGTYLTGTESALDGTLSATFNDGSVQNIGIAKNAVAGAQFFGFTDAGKSILSVTINEAGPFDSRDIFGIDNLQFAAAPEPGTLWVVALGIPVAWFGVRRRQRR
jgi:hypothetical protein